MVNSKNAFWQALVVALAVFLAGFFLGSFLEDYRVDKTQDILFNAETHVLDEQLRQNAGADFEVDCAILKRGIFDFADRIYDDASKLEEYDQSSKLRSSFLLTHKRYDLLRTYLWAESKDFSERCPQKFHRVVYLYSYSTQDLDVKAEESFFSRLLLDLKYKYPEEVLLIPIAVDMNLSSVDMLVSSYNLTRFPVVFVDEDVKIDKIITFEELEKIVLDSNTEN